MTLNNKTQAEDASEIPEASADDIAAPNGNTSFAKQLYDRCDEHIDELDSMFERHNGKVLCILANTRYFLWKLGIATRFNEFDREIELRGMPGHDRLTEEALRTLWAGCDRVGYFITVEVLHQHLRAIALEHSYHSARDLIDACEREWDGTPRLDTYLTVYAKVKDSQYTRFVGRSALMAAVRRLREPGFPYKYVPVLEGTQDARKSSFLRALALVTKYFDDNLEMGASSKETIELTAGKLIIELGELASKKKAAMEKIKAFIARTHDRARLSYDKTVSEVPRQFSVWGTTNDDNWLTDPTGNVRFWPLKVQATADDPIDIDGLKGCVRQLWGEAAALERRARENNDLVLLYPSAEIAALAAAEQDARYGGDETHEVLRDVFDPLTLKELLAKHGLAGVFLTNERLRVFLSSQFLNDNGALDFGRIKRSMTALGWKYERRYMPDGSKHRGYAYGALPPGRVSEGEVLSVDSDDMQLLLESSIINVTAEF